MDYYSIDFLRTDKNMLKELQDKCVSVNVFSLSTNLGDIKKDEEFVSKNFVSYNLCFCKTMKDANKFASDGNSVIVGR